MHEGPASRYPCPCPAPRPSRSPRRRTRRTRVPHAANRARAPRQDLRGHRGDARDARGSRIAIPVPVPRAKTSEVTAATHAMHEGPDLLGGGGMSRRDARDVPLAVPVPRATAVEATRRRTRCTKVHRGASTSAEGEGCHATTLHCVTSTSRVSRPRHDDVPTRWLPVSHRLTGVHGVGSLEPHLGGRAQPS